MGRRDLVAVCQRAGAPAALKRTAIIQARMSSTRLPGKVLLPLGERPMLAQQIRRVRSARLVDEVVIATSDSTADDPIAELASREGVACFRGPEHDVLKRYLLAARWAGAEVVIRLTGDCPLVDPGVTDEVVAALTPDFDYASNVLRRTWPRGLDVECMFRDTLERLDRLARSPEAREHVTVLLRSERPELFLRRSVEGTRDDSGFRITVDGPEDLEVVREIFDSLQMETRTVGLAEILDLLRGRPELAARNRDVSTWDPRPRR